MSDPGTCNVIIGFSPLNPFDVTGVPSGGGGLFGGRDAVDEGVPQDPGVRPGFDKALGPPPPPPIPIYCQPDVIKAMGRAWARTVNGSSGNEAGFVLNGTPSNYSIVDTKSGYTQNTQKMKIFPDTFLLFHVHPNSSTRNPSTPKNNALGRKDAGDTFVSDTYQAKGQTILFLVGHRTGLTMYDPRTGAFKDLRENLDWTEKCK